MKYNKSMVSWKDGSSTRNAVCFTVVPTEENIENIIDDAKKNDFHLLWGVSGKDEYILFDDINIVSWTTLYQRDMIPEHAILFKSKDLKTFVENQRLVHVSGVRHDMFDIEVGEVEMELPKNLSVAINFEE